jgi:hypothetical protein
LFLSRGNSSQLFDDCGLVGIDSGSSSEHYFAGMKKLLFLGACLVALASSPVMAQTGGADVVVVRVNEGSAAVGSNCLIVVRGKGKSEKIAFPTEQQIAGPSAQALTTSGEIMQGVFAKLHQQGYTLKSTFGHGSTTTLIFAKGK